MIRSKIVRRVLLVIVGLVAMKACSNLVLNGSILRNCPYTETVVQIPASFANGEIQLGYDVAIGKGFESAYSCLPMMGKIPQHIMGAEDSKWEHELKFAIADTESDIRLKPEKIIVVTKHGLSTIDSGSGPIVYLILKDKEGQFFSIADVDMGIRESESILTFIVGKEKQRLVMSSVQNIQNFEFFPEKIIDPYLELPTPEEIEIRRKNCEINERQGDEGCCRKSLELILYQKYPLFKGRCARGYKMKKYPCFTSMSWCQPQ